MKNTATWILALTIISTGTLLIGCQPGQPKSDKDQLSYTIGANYGKQLKAQKVEINPKMITKGIEDAMSDKTLAMTEEEMRASLDKAGQEFQKRNAEEASKNLEASKAYLEQNKAKEGVVTTASGLQYKIIEEGSGAPPTDTNIVQVHYRGKLIDGTEFDSSHKNNAPASFPLNQVILGWQEGLKLMKKGGKYELVIPPDLAYGSSGRPGIPANAVLVFEVELLDIQKAEAKK